MNIESYIRAITVSRVNKKEIGARIRQKRVDARMLQSQLADACGVRPLTMWRYEAGKQLPGTETLDKLSSQLGVSVEWILHGEAYKKSLKPSALPLIESEEFLIWTASMAPGDVNEDELKILKSINFLDRHPGPQIYTMILSMVRMGPTQKAVPVNSAIRPKVA